MSSKGKLTLSVPQDVIDEAKKKINNVSEFVTEQLEMEIYREAPELLEKKLDLFDKKTDHQRDLLLAQIKVAKEKHQLKKQRMDQVKPEIRRYGELIDDNEVD